MSINMLVHCVVSIACWSILFYSRFVMQRCVGLLSFSVSSVLFWDLCTRVSFSGYIRLYCGVSPHLYDDVRYVQ